MTMLHFTEDVVLCEVCGFVGLVGVRSREWVAYQMARTVSHRVQFGFCSECGIIAVRSGEGKPISFQEQIRLQVNGEVQLGEWIEKTEYEVCPRCKQGNTIIWSLPQTSDGIACVRCPECCEYLKVANLRVKHPKW